MTINYYLYGLSSRSDEHKQIKNYSELKIGVVAGGVTQKLLEEQGFKNITLAKDYIQLNNLIHKKRVDLIASSSFGILVSRFNYPEGYFLPYMKLSDREVNLYYALSKDSSSDVANRLQSILEKNKQELNIPKISYEKSIKSQN